MSAGSIRIAAARPHVAAQLWPMPLWLAALVAAAGLGALDLAVDPHRILKLIGDTDDATRLTQVRDLLAGAPWTDTTIARIGAPEPLVSHWSRLIDLPIALMISILKPFLGMDRAETVTRFAWPLMVLWPTIWLIARETEQRGGRRAAYMAVVLAGTAINALMQFMPGRIDHHNVMILGAVAGTLMLARSMSDERAGWAAGGLLGLGMAIGYEALPLTAIGLVITSAYALASGQGITGVSRAAAAFAATLTAALLSTTAPAKLLVSHCDALSLNLVLLAASGAAGLGVVAVRGAGWPLAMRLGVPALIVGCGLTLAAVAQPACLKGPFGEFDPAIGPLLLDGVIETRSVFYMLSMTPATMIVFLITAALGITAATRDWLRARDAQSGLTLAVLIAADAAACWQIKLVPYAVFLAVPPIALMFSRIDADAPDSGAVSTSAKRMIAVLGLNQLLLYILVTPAVAALHPVKNATAAWHKSVQACIGARASAALSELPGGLVLSDRDLGPYIVAKSQLRVVSAPYHRIDKALIATERIMKARPDEAEREIKALGATYVAVCEGLNGGKLEEPEGAGEGFRARLISGRTPAFLEAVPLANATPIKVWRVK